MPHLNDPVFHSTFGPGEFVADQGDTWIVRFPHGLEQRHNSEFELRSSVSLALQDGALSEPIDALARGLGLAIRSANDQWGVFSRSRIALLPHQLWVCRQVSQSWPLRWLIADDVGLGKTIEAGLIMMPLIASATVRRLLVLAPAKLVPQWQERLKSMFDIRLQSHAANVSGKAFWDAADKVVASIHTMRARPEEILAAEPWDLVIVDEAHHLNVAENGDKTLGFDLLARMQEENRIRSLLLFTGTPHRGKDRAFFSLMSLLRPDLFDAKRDPQNQYANLPLAMIRNNKAQVTDLHGNKLFKPVTVKNWSYHYSEAEQNFYDTMSLFIVDGRAYADKLDARGQSARMLLLIALQKLAASSVAAIASALKKRREMLARSVSSSSEVNKRIDYAPSDATLDDLAEQEELLPGQSTVDLLSNEIQRIDELLQLAEEVGEETKIVRLLEFVDKELPPREPLLLFTEYKATQALVVEALEARFGPGSSGFINGDDALPVGTVRDGIRRIRRDVAANDFNSGKTRFLVSTEAGGEGIDLQWRCANLVHVDMPWNPMRLHQRVGRLSRYGQTRPVDVFILRNPDTVEARIWDKLNTKLARIQQMLSSVMDVEEDISSLVVGVVGEAFFERLFSEGRKHKGNLDGWFEADSERLGGKDIIDTVRDMFGNVSRFDFDQVGRDVPKVDLPDLEQFLRVTLQRHGRRLGIKQTGPDEPRYLDFISPKSWADTYYIDERYEDLQLSRKVDRAVPVSKVMGVGHAVLDMAIQEAEAIDATVAVLEGIASPILVASIVDQVTATGASVRRIVVGAECGGEGPRIMRDWELVLLLNGCSVREELRAAPFDHRLKDEALGLISDRIKQLAPMMQAPVIRPAILFVPKSN